MTDVQTGSLKQPLGVGSIISETFSILFGNFLKVLLLSVLPTVAGLALLGATIGWDAALGNPDPAAFAAGGWMIIFLPILVGFIISSLTTALLVQLAYDAKLKRSIDIGSYWGPAIRSLFPVIVLSLISGILVGLASILLIVPGLWLYAVLSVIVPAIVIERAGFGAMGRSAALTKEYRWPILGALIVIIIIALIIGGIIGFLGAFSTGGYLFGGLFEIVINGVSYGFGGILVALIYARLREIKEGVGVDQIAAVFD